LLHADIANTTVSNIDTPGVWEINGSDRGECCNRLTLFMAFQVPKTNGRLRARLSAEQSIDQFHAYPDIALARKWTNCGL
jgi:hypothetical protein